MTKRSQSLFPWSVKAQSKKALVFNDIKLTREDLVSKKTQISERKNSKILRLNIVSNVTPYKVLIEFWDKRQNNQWK